MEITVLHTKECPNLVPLLAELEELVAGRDDIVVTTRLVASAAEAAALSFHGSPTILIDGDDPFPHGPPPGALSCRLYAGENGRPSRDAMAHVLMGAA